MSGLLHFLFAKTLLGVILPLTVKYIHVSKLYRITEKTYSDVYNSPTDIGVVEETFTESTHLHLPTDESHRFPVPLISEQDSSLSLSHSHRDMRRE